MHLDACMGAAGGQRRERWLVNQKMHSLGRRLRSLQSKYTEASLLPTILSISIYEFSVSCNTSPLRARTHIQFFFLSKTAMWDDSSVKIGNWSSELAGFIYSQLGTGSRSSKQSSCGHLISSARHTHTHRCEAQNGVTYWNNWKALAPRKGRLARDASTTAARRGPPPRHATPVSADGFEQMIDQCAERNCPSPTKITGSMQNINESINSSFFHIYIKRISIIDISIPCTIGRDDFFFLLITELMPTPWRSIRREICRARYRACKIFDYIN